MFYVIGHKCPDTDSICSAIAYSYLTKKCSKCDVVPGRIGEINPETKFVLDKFGFKVPLNVDKAREGDQFQLVDHNSYEDSIKGLKDEMIVGIIDHHKLKMCLNNPRYVRTEPVGCTCTIIATMFRDCNIKIPKNIAGIMLGSILSDTVIFKSPTTTKIDKDVAKELANIVGIKNMKEFGIEIKKQKCDFCSMSAKKVILMDYKEFSTAGKKYSVNQVEVVDTKEINERKQEILESLEKNRQKKGLDFSLMMVTDILKEGTTMWGVGDVSASEKAYGKKFVKNTMWLNGVMSRKKQVVPIIDKILEK